MSNGAFHDCMHLKMKMSLMTMMTMKWSLCLRTKQAAYAWDHFEKRDLRILSVSFLHPAMNHHIKIRELPSHSGFHT
ncbi:hypothetical protein Hanom_Chr02g00177451 [Helianthus anomalus]